MIVRCTNCGSADTQAMLGVRAQCLRCGFQLDTSTGEHMPTDGQPEAPPVPDPADPSRPVEWPSPGDAPAEPASDPEPIDEPEPEMAGTSKKKR